MAILVTFRCNSRTLRYKPGHFYTEELTPILKKVLEQDRQLSLIDPPSLDVSYLKPPKMNKKTFTPETPVEKIEMENIENGYEREEDVQNFGGAGASGISD